MRFPRWPDATLLPSWTYLDTQIARQERSPLGVGHAATVGHEEEGDGSVNSQLSKDAQSLLEQQCCRSGVEQLPSLHRPLMLPCSLWQAPVPARQQLHDALGLGQHIFALLQDTVNVKRKGELGGEGRGCGGQLSFWTELWAVDDRTKIASPMWRLCRQKQVGGFWGDSLLRPRARAGRRVRAERRTTIVVPSFLLVVCYRG